MKDRKRVQTWPKEIIVFGIITILGFIVLGSIFAIEWQKEQRDLAGLWQSVVVSILTSLVASFIFILIQKAFFREENKELDRQLREIEQRLKMQNELYDSGIISIHPKAYFDEEADYWRNIINNTENRLDLIGHSISNWFRDEYCDLFCNKILKMLEKGKEVRIVLSTDEFNIQRVKHVYSKSSQFSRKDLNKTEKTVLNFLNLVEGRAEEYKKYLKLYVTDLSKVTYLYIRTDDRCIISPYIYLGMTKNPNSFLLELQKGTGYTKALEDSFEDVVGSIDSLDLSVKRFEVVNGMELIKLITVENQYSGSNWNFEKTTKYVFQEGEIKYEAGYFEHFMDDKYIKSVIELPVSYGCPSKCRFCASSGIDEFDQMNADQLMSLFLYIHKCRKLDNKDYILVTMTGTGDIFFNWKNVMDFLQRLTVYKNVHITVSSCLWNKSLLKRFDRYSERLSVRNVQLTYVSDKQDVLEKVIPIYKSRSFPFDDILAYIADSDNTYYRINYIMIQGINDTEEDFSCFKNKILKIKDKVVVRISKLNETDATNRNGLSPSNLSEMEKFRDLLIASGIKAYVFFSQKNDHMNCGQLITE